MEMNPSRPDRTPGTKMIYLIKRRRTTSRDELIVHWYANHMPPVIQAQKDQAVRGRPHARRYIATLFEASDAQTHGWDGMAQLWWDRALPKPKEPHGTHPTDSFQQKAEPYLPWATTEYVVIDGSENLKVEPLTLNASFPCTRSGFFKVSFLVTTNRDIDCDELFSHWLDVHVPNVRSTMLAVGGFRYVVSHSVDPKHEPYAGLAELYFHDPTGWARYREAIEDDGMGRWIDRRRMPVLTGVTELIGLP